MIKNGMKLGRFYGIFVLIIGVVFSWFAFTMTRDAGFTIRLFVAGPLFVVLGLAFLVFPGGDITAKESREKTKDPGVVFSQAPQRDKIAWGVAATIGAIITLVLVV